MLINSEDILKYGAKKVKDLCEAGGVDVFYSRVLCSLFTNCGSVRKTNRPCYLTQILTFCKLEINLSKFGSDPKRELPLKTANTR